MNLNCLYSNTNSQCFHTRSIYSNLSSSRDLNVAINTHGINSIWITNTGVIDFTADPVMKLCIKVICLPVSKSFPFSTVRYLRDCSIKESTVSVEIMWIPSECVFGTSVFLFCFLSVHTSWGGGGLQKTSLDFKNSCSAIIQRGSRPVWWKLCSTLLLEKERLSSLRWQQAAGMQQKSWWKLSFVLHSPAFHS